MSRRSTEGHRDALVGYQGVADDREPRERPSPEEYDGLVDDGPVVEGPRFWDEATRFRWLRANGSRR